MDNVDAIIDDVDTSMELLMMAYILLTSHIQLIVSYIMLITSFMTQLIILIPSLTMLLSRENLGPVVCPINGLHNVTGIYLKGKTEQCESQVVNGTKLVRWTELNQEDERN